MANYRRSVILKKTFKWKNDLSRRSRRQSPNGSLLLNSTPKSGTFLLHSILSNLTLRDLGGFIATTPSFFMNRRDDASIVRSLNRVGCRELCVAHIVHSSEIEAALVDMRMPQVFVFRDPVAVFEAELFYLSEVNRWHRLHREYDKAGTFDDKFDLCLNGYAGGAVYYPPFARRYTDFSRWVFSSSCHAVKYEDLVLSASSLHDELLRLSEFLSGVGLLRRGDIGDFVRSSMRSASPDSSHTYVKRHPRREDYALSDEQASIVRLELSSWYRSVEGSGGSAIPNGARAGG